MWGDISGAIDLILLSFGVGTGIISTLLYQFVRQRANFEVLKMRYEDILESNRQNFEEIKRIIDAEVEKMRREVMAMVKETEELNQSIKEIVRENTEKIDHTDKRVGEIEQDIKTVKGAVNRNIARLDVHDRILQDYQEMNGKIDALLAIAQGKTID